MSDYRRWMLDPFTQIVLACLDRDRREKALDITTNIPLDSNTTSLLIAKFKGQQQVLEMLVTKNALLEEVLNNHIEWQDIE